MIEKYSHWFPALPHLAALQAAYDARLKAGEVQYDAAQQSAVAQLQAFAERLDGYRPARPGLWDRLTGKNRPEDAPQGFYLYGDVGRGKSMLMDLFYDHVGILKKRRVHFHQFMLEIHQRLHQLQQDRFDDILPELAKELAEEAWLLCFDEFHVNNIVDAMILGRLFGALFDAGVIIVTTSNWAPDELYKNGLQRDRFLPFIELIRQKMEIYRLNGAVDHRYEKLGSLPAYFSPLNDETTRKLQGIFMELTEEAPVESIRLPVQGRSLDIVHAAKGVGFFNYDELCITALGAADYLAIAHCLHTVVMDGVPKFKPEQRNEISRFMILIDTLYEAKVKFFMASAAPIAQLGPATGDYAYPFQRTVSRLMEMQGEEYRQRMHMG